MSDKPLNFGMGSRRPKAPVGKPRYEPAFVDEWGEKPFPKGSLVSTPDGSRARVIAMRDDGDNRVVEFLDGPSAGGRQVFQPRQLFMIEHPGPRPAAPAAGPVVNRPAGPAFADDADGQLRREQHAKMLAERYDTVTRNAGKEGMGTVQGEGQLKPAGPIVVQGDFSPDQFPATVGGRLSRRKPSSRAARSHGTIIESGWGQGVVSHPGGRSRRRPGFVPAKYTRTKRRDPASDDPICVFDGYDIPAPPAPSTAPAAVA